MGREVVLGSGQSARFRTQISGKYSPDNPGVFEMKRQLVEAGVDVRFPVGDEIIEYSLGFAITVPHEAEVPFHGTQVKFFREIRDNHLQITYDVYGELDGYVGESTGIETAYALVCNKPIILLRPPVAYSATLPPQIRALIERYLDGMVIATIDRLPMSQLADFVHQTGGLRVDYGLTQAEKDMVMIEALTLTKKYRALWQEYGSRQQTPEE